jgi:hypothetical protein
LLPHWHSYVYPSDFFLHLLHCHLVTLSSQLMSPVYMLTWCLCCTQLPC